MLEKIKANKYIFIIVLVWGIFSSPVLVGKTPFPADYQVNFFSPWTSYPGMKGPVKNNAQPDIVGQLYPWRHFTITELKKGQIPFWNPYSFAGTPHLANYQSSVLFPLNILFFLPFNFVTAWSIFVILQPLLAGIFMYLLMKMLKVSQKGALVASFSFMFCGFIITWMGYATLGYAILPLPFAIYSILKFKDSKKTLWLVLLSLCFPFSFFAGHFQTSIYFAAAVIGYIFINLLLDKNKKIYFYCLIFSLSGILMAMPQLFPSLEFYSNAVRSEIFAKIEAIPISYLPTLFAPDFFGNPVTRNDWFGHYAEWSGYAGIIALSLAVYTILFNRTRKTLYFILLFILSLILSLDTPIIDFIISLKLPVISTSSSSRIIVLFSFSVAVLAGIGLDSLYKERNKNRFIKWFLAIVSIILIILFVGFQSMPDKEKAFIGIKNSVLPLSLFLTFFVGSFLSLKIKKQKVRDYAFLIIVVLSAFEMYRFASKWQNFDAASNAFVITPVIEFLTSVNEYDRVVGFTSAEVSVYYKIPILSGYDPLYIEDYGKFAKFVGSGEIGALDRSAVLFPSKGNLAQQAIDYLGVKYIAHKYSDKDYPWAFPIKNYPKDQLFQVYDDGKYQVFENKNSFSRSFLVSNIKKISDTKKALEYIFTNDLKNTAVIDGEVEKIEENASGSAVIEEYKQSYIRIKSNSSGNALLVLTDNFYPGWKAYINESEAKIVKVNTTFRGVYVPKGESIVEFKYLPLSFYYGLYLFSLGLLIVLSFIIVTRLKVINK